MKKPKMIIFDYGHTLLYEPEWNALRGERALFEYITENPYSLTPEEICGFSEKIFAGADNARKVGYEYHEHQGLRLKNEYLGLKYSVPLEEAEIILWRGISEGEKMPGVEEMLDYLGKNGIRSAVVSNIGFSGGALTERLNRLLPENRFEFVVASSEYGIRKPNPMIFNLALRKAGLDAGDVWYCGDRPDVDAEGSASAGMFPVWYDNALDCPYRDRSIEAPPRCPHLHIHEWDELTETLEGLK